MPLDLCTPCFITSKALHSFLLVSPFSLSAMAQIQPSLTLPGAHFISPLSLPYPYSVSPTKLLAVKVACYASLWPLVPYTGLTMSKQMNTWAHPLLSHCWRHLSCPHNWGIFTGSPYLAGDTSPTSPQGILSYHRISPVPTLPSSPPPFLFSWILFLYFISFIYSADI